jgi:hypothetical protein
VGRDWELRHVQTGNARGNGTSKRSQSPWLGIEFGEVQRSVLIGLLMGCFRPTMIMTGCSNIRELLGHKCSIEWIESQPAVRLEKAAAAS